VWCVPNGSFSSNCYIGKTGKPGECIVVDPGLDGEAIDARLRGLQLRPTMIFCTHGHFDHFGSAAHLQETYDATVFMHAADERIMKTSNFMLMALHLSERVKLPQLHFIDDGFAIDAGPTLEFLPSPGHTPGSCLLRWGDAIFSGDTIYAEGIGLSGLPGEDKQLLRQSLVRYWDLLPGESMLLPGHGKAALFSDVQSGNRALRAFLGLHQTEKGEDLPCSQPAVSPSPG
jgi:glyoxylase-like metal-dependent hydrolase (beta-lactamase superfamily II)